MNVWYADLHIHIGRTESGRPVKISGSANLTFHNIAREASERKGMDITGIIDCHSPSVQLEMERLLDSGEMEEVSGGGIRYRNTVIIPGAEIELREQGGFAPFHVLAYFPDFPSIRDFTRWLSRHMKNVELSSQRLHAPASALQEEVAGRGGLLVPAHIFTPHKSVYAAHGRLSEVLDPERIAAVELGLSADTAMADRISELDRCTFLTSSDAHSLGKIGREYNELVLAVPSFLELKRAFGREEGRRVSANYGLDPRLGKYYRTHCTSCGQASDACPDAGTDVGSNACLDAGLDAGSDAGLEARPEVVLGAAPDTGPPVGVGASGGVCRRCGKRRLVRGVSERIAALADKPAGQSPGHRPPYRLQVPLEFIPGLGPRKLQRLYEAVGTEMRIVHRASKDELLQVLDEQTAALIMKARSGSLTLDAGGGGRYGRVIG